MDKEYVYGSEISVTFCYGSEFDFSTSPFKGNKGFNSNNEASGTSSSSRDSSASPPREKDMCKNRTSDFSCSKFDFPPPPVLDNNTFPSLLKNSFKDFLSTNCTNSNMFPVSCKLDIHKETKNFQLDWNVTKSLSQNCSNRDLSAFSPFKKEMDSKVKMPQKNVGRVTPFVMQESEKNGRSPYSDPGGIRTSNKIENTTNSYMFNNANYTSSVLNVGSSFDIQHISDQYFYSPTWNGATANDPALSLSRVQVPSLESSSYVELHVSNLDPAFEVNEMKRILLSIFREHVMVLHISMSLQPDGSPKATVKVPSLQDAQFAISRLHRKKIGHKRILISHVSSNKSPPFHVLKSETITLLNDIPNKSLPLIKFRELYEKRYHRPIAVSELYKMKEAVSIQGDSGSRIVFLNSEYCNTPSLPDSEDSQECNVMEKPYCEVHFHVSSSEGWEEQYNICPLPLVHISLKTLATAVHRLLDSHQGSLPLVSFCDCYEAEIGPLPVVENFNINKDESFEVSSDANHMSTIKESKGVPLEHLIACITGVEVAKTSFCIKKVQWLENRNDSQVFQNFSPALVGQLTLFGREVMDLLKNQPHCLVQFNKFIPTYHHHFGRQCRVADYGFTKLIDLLEAIPHIVQVLGEGQNRQVTLTHRTQVKRFAGELLRILKSRASKQISISEFPQAYEQVIERPFDITSYGVCEIEDIINEVPESVIVTSGSGSETIISIPKREQTPEEVERTKQFADEVVELMRHTTNCSMAFNKFIPSYHHHFGKQCRVADYGFTKLIELFEVIPNILEVKGTGEDKVLHLVESERQKVLIERLVKVLKAQPNEIIVMSQLYSAYIQVHGHALRPLDFGFSNLEELLETMDSHFKIINYAGTTYVCLINHELLRRISLNIRKLLMEQEDGKMLVKDLFTYYQIRFQQNIDVISFMCDLTGIVEVTNGVIQLTPVQLLARDIIVLLKENGSQIPLSSLGTLFHQKYGVPICSSDYGFQSISSMLEHFSDYFIVKGKKQKRIISLISGMNDILNQPVPNCIPKPTIEPNVRENFNLMGFETPPIQSFHYLNNSSFNPQPVEEKWTFTNTRKSHSFGLNNSTRECSIKKSDLQNSLSESFFHIVHPFEISSNFSVQSASTSCDKNKKVATDFNLDTEMLTYSKDSCKKWFLHHPSKLEEELDVNFKQNAIGLSQNHNSSEHAEQNMMPNIAPCLTDSSSSDISNEYKNHSSSTKDCVPSTKSTPTSEGKQGRRNRIAAQFTAPIDD